MPTYTCAEAAVIRSAFAQIDYIAETKDCSAPFRLREALKYETRHRSNRTVAQALMVAAFMEGMDGYWRQTPATPADLYDISTGLAFAHMFGADTARRHATSREHVDQVGAGRFRDRVRDLVAVAGEAAKAHAAQQERRCAK